MSDQKLNSVSLVELECDMHNLSETCRTLLMLCGSDEGSEECLRAGMGYIGGNLRRDLLAMYEKIGLEPPKIL